MFIPFLSPKWLRKKRQKAKNQQSSLSRSLQSNVFTQIKSQAVLE